MSRDDDLAADLVHEAFLRLVREVQADRTPDRIGAWLFRVVRNLAISDIRRRKSLEKACAYLKVEDAADAPEMTALEREREGWLRAAFSRLNADQRTALHFAASGLTGREAARAMGRSECATRAMLWRARNRLRRDFAAFGAS
jgi:RNA polymerase sigma-70 factor (ECF subfamily)